MPCIVSTVLVCTIPTYHHKKLINQISRDIQEVIFKKKTHGMIRWGRINKNGYVKKRKGDEM